MDTLIIIVSSGVVAAFVSILSVVLMLGTYKQKVDTHETGIEKHNTKISELSDRVSRLEGGVDRDRAHNEYIKRKSPLNLTEKGKAMLLDSSGNDYIDKNKETLVDAVRSKSPKTAYDIQELARKVIEERSNDDAFNPIKEFAFKNGHRLELLIDIMGIYFRDIALKEMGYSLKDLD